MNRWGCAVSSLVLSNFQNVCEDALLQDPRGSSEELALHPVHYTDSHRIGHPDCFLPGRIRFQPFHSLLLANPD